MDVPVQYFQSVIALETAITSDVIRGYGSCS